MSGAVITKDENMDWEKLFSYKLGEDPKIKNNHENTKAGKHENIDGRLRDFVSIDLFISVYPEREV